MKKSNLQFRGASMSQLLQSLATAFVSTFPTGTTFVIDGVTYTGAQIAAVFLQMKALFDAAEDARQLFIKAIAGRDAQIPNVRALIAGVVAMLEAMYGKDSATFAKFGVPAKKTPRALTSEEKLAAKVKAKATRTLRGTKGKRQKEQIKAQGEPTVNAIMPGASPASLDGAQHG